MKLSKFILFMFAMSITTFLFSCSEDSSPTPPATTDYSAYYPLSVGSWWIYEEWKTDSNFNPDSLITRDSVVIESTTMFNGKNAFVKVTYDILSGVAIDTTYEYFENNSLYEWTQLNPFTNEQEGWVERGSFTKDYIKYLDTNVTDLIIGDMFSFSGSIKMDITKGINKIINLKNKDYTAFTYNNSAIIDGNATIPGLGSVPMKVDMTGEMFFAKNIGIAQTLTTQTALIMGMGEPEYSKRILTDWSVK